MAVFKKDRRDREIKRRGHGMMSSPLLFATLGTWSLPSVVSYCSVSLITSLIIPPWIYKVQTLSSIYFHRFLIQNSLKHNLSLPLIDGVGRDWFLLSEAQRG